jgi:hypothetical protein
MKIQPDGSYTGKVTIGYKPNGKPIQKMLRASSPIEFLKLHYELRKGIQDIKDRSKK